MNKTVLAVIIISLCTSCVTRRACERKYPTASITEAQRTTEVFIRDTIVQVIVRESKLEDSVKLDIDSVSFLESVTASSKAWIKDGMLHHSLVQKDTAIDIAIKGAIRTVKTKEHIDTTEIKEPVYKGSFIGTVLWPFLQLVIIITVLLLAVRAFSR